MQSPSAFGLDEADVYHLSQTTVGTDDSFLGVRIMFVYRLRVFCLNRRGVC